MKKQLKKKNVYDDDDFDYSDYLPPHYPYTYTSTRNIQQPQQHHQEEEEEKEKTPTKPKYCFV
jgi:hypothetical protein